MSKRNLLFSCDLYENKAVVDAAAMFGEFAKITVKKMGNDFRMTIAMRPAVESERAIIGEIMNFVLARTVELRAG